MWCEVAGWGSQEPSAESNAPQSNANDWFSDLLGLQADTDLSIGLSGGFSVSFIIQFNSVMHIPLTN